MSRTILLLALSLPLAACAADRGFHLASGSLRDGDALPSAQVYRGDGCSGGNRSPALTWSGAPAATRSVAVTMFDPDAPTGHGWWHWLAFDLPAATQSLSEGASDGLPSGALQARNDFGTPGYGGACPPPGDGPHRYVITVHALSVAHLGLPATASPAVVDAALRRNSLATARLTLHYQR